MLELKIPPVAVTLIFACLMAGIALATPSQTVDALLLDGLGVAILIAGALVCLAGVKAFRDASTTVDPTKPHNATSLVRGGVYRWTRNPMYLGFFMMLLGLGLILGNWCALIAGLLFVPYMNRFQIEPEERVLAGIFGPDFDVFRRDVRRWL